MKEQPEVARAIKTLEVRADSPAVPKSEHKAGKEATADDVCGSNGHEYRIDRHKLRSHSHANPSTDHVASDSTTVLRCTTTINRRTEHADRATNHVQSTTGTGTTANSTERRRTHTVTRRIQRHGTTPVAVHEHLCRTNEAVSLIDDDCGTTRRVGESQRSGGHEPIGAYDTGAIVVSTVVRKLNNLIKDQLPGLRPVD